MILKNFCQFFAFTPEFIKSSIVVFKCFDQSLIVAKLFLEVPDALNDLPKLFEETAVFGSTLLLGFVIDAKNFSSADIKLYDFFKFYFLCSC